jgi:hypothetical protein
MNRDERASTMATAGAPDCPVDGHVHFHSIERAALTLDAAADNFRRFGPREDDACQGILLLTQAGGEHVFERMREQATCGTWRIEPVRAEEQSLIARRDGIAIAVICGRQVRCERGLEVTALGTILDYPDGRPLPDTIAEVKASGAVVSLPWGFGKWLGSRGSLVRAALREHAPGSIAICDNGSRLQFLGQPPLVREAGQRGFQVLPGTDPFPFGDDYRRVGSFGFLAMAPKLQHPWRDLRAWLSARDDSPPAFGQALGLVRFLVNNVGIQLRNRLRKGQN